jgi:serine protease Do
MDASSAGADPAPKGALVAQVYRGHPADVAGVKAGDVITRVGETAIASVADVSSVVAKLAPGTTVDIELARSGATIVVRVTLAERPSGETV